MAKNHEDNEYVPYIPVDMNIIDPLRNLPKIKIQGKEIERCKVPKRICIQS